MIYQHDKYKFTLQHGWIYVTVVGVGNLIDAFKVADHDDVDFMAEVDAWVAEWA